jgi:hypothetical protein
MAEEKQPGWIGLLFENFNSIGIGTQDWKIYCLNSLIESLRIDIVSGCETNIDWRLIDDAHQLLDVLVPGTGKRGVVSHNTTAVI